MLALSSISVIFIAWIGFAILYVAYYKLFHPLARYPGPFWASLTNLWSLSLSVAGDWPERMDVLHARYGPIVRIAPNEVAIDDPKAIKDIYGLAKGFRKSSFYRPFGNPNQHDNLFNTTSDDYHGQLRRWAGNAFAMSTMTGFEKAIEGVVARLISHLDPSKPPLKNADAVTDLGDKLRCFAFDVSALLSCGQSFGCIENGDSSGLMNAFSLGNIAGAHVGRFPSSYPIFARLRPPPALVKGFSFCNEFLEAQMKRHESEMKVEGISKRTNQDQMALLLQASHSGKSDTPYTLLAPVRDRIKQMCQSIIAAGSDTTGTTLTALFYFLLHDKGAMNKLMEEVELNASSIDDNDNGSFSLQTANRMPYLNACIKETLRLHPAVAFSLPRIVPKEGAVIAGRCFTGGTTVGVNAWQIHQHEEVFGPECRKFNPERWLTEDKSRLSEMERYMFAFGAGSRTCIGKNISLVEMRILVPSLLLAYHFELVDDHAPLQYISHWFAIADHLPVTITKRERRPL